jgi:glycine C-acetyltransferase
LALKPKFAFVDSELEVIKKNHLYRKLRDAKVHGSAITIKGKKLVNLCSNDYLGIAPTPMSINQMQSSSRLVSGNDEEYKILENKLARHKSQQDSLIYPTGYMANLGVVCSIAKKGDLILSDEFQEPRFQFTNIMTWKICNQN